MAVAPDTAAELVYQIFDLQRAVRCIGHGQLAGRTPEWPFKGCCGSWGRGKPAPPGWPNGWESARPSSAATSRSLRSTAWWSAGRIPTTAGPSWLPSPAGSREAPSRSRSSGAVLQEYLRDWSEEDAGETAKSLQGSSNHSGISPGNGGRRHQ
jgi:hypothetical protein